MRIAVNTRFLIKNKLEGIGWFTYETMKRITQNHPEHEFLFLFDRQWDDEFIFSDNIIPVKVLPPARHPYLWQYWYEYAVPKVLKKYKPDLFISTDGMLSLSTKIPTILVMHDLAYIHYPHHVPKSAYQFLQKNTPKYLQKATRIITVSAYSKKDLIDTYEIESKKIDVAYNGANEIFSPLTDQQKHKTRYELTEGVNYFIYVGSIHPRKNIGNLLLAFDAFKKESKSKYKLVVAGRMAWKTQDTKDIYEHLRSKNDVIFSGHLGLKNLKNAIGAADALIYPSLFEGFGIPVLEARYCAVPVLCSNRTSIPEVAGEHAIYFDPENITDIKNSMIQFTGSKNKMIHLAADAEAAKKQFNWDLSATQIEESINKVNNGFKLHRKKHHHTRA